MLSFIFLLLLLPFSLVHGTIPELRQADRDSFPEYLTGLTLVEFFSPNCYHCRQYKRVIRKLDRFIYDNSESLHQMKLMQFNCKGGYYCQELGLEAIPALRLYLNSVLLGTLDGVAHTDEVLKWVFKLIKKNQRIIHQAMRPANAEYEIDVESSSDFSDEELETEGQDTEQPAVIESPVATTVVSTAQNTPFLVSPQQTTAQVATTPVATTVKVTPSATPVPTTATLIPLASPPMATTPNNVATVLTTTPKATPTPATTAIPNATPAKQATTTPTTTPQQRVATATTTPVATRVPTPVHRTPVHHKAATTTPRRVATPTPKATVAPPQAVHSK